MGSYILGPLYLECIKHNGVLFYNSEDFSIKYLVDTMKVIFLNH